MPLSYVRQPNNAPFEGLDPDAGSGESFKNLEAAFQISLKFPLADNLIVANDSLRIGFTTVSFWQAYNGSISAPFRETNYEPEIFWGLPLNWRPFNVDATALAFGLSHQSNGRSGSLSRSWNRIYANLIWEQGDFVFSFKPWWRIPEDAKANAQNASGNDNPDIERFMGHFEFTTIYRRDDQEFSLMARNNLRSDNKGALQFD